MSNSERSVEHIDVAVIGAGVIGLAIAREYALQNREVFIFESQPRHGTETSSHNSEVIHSGIYYSDKTQLKAKHCIEGKALLYTYCEEHGVRTNKIGKLLIATSEDEVNRLASLYEQAHANGVHDLEWLEQKDIQALEPEVFGVLGMLSPSTGIIDSDGLMMALKNDAVRMGANLIVSTSVAGGEVRDDGIELSLADGDNTKVLANIVINAAGLHASHMASSIKGLSAGFVPETRFAKGNYFTFNSRPFHHLIYPMPVQGGLGIHATLDLEGNVRFGPDVEWVSCIDYSLDPTRVRDFYPAIRRYFPYLPDGSLQPGYAGIRPKLSGPGGVDCDFRISGKSEHGIDGLINLFGIESPGLTASLSISKQVMAMTS